MEKAELKLQELVKKMYDIMMSWQVMFQYARRWSTAAILIMILSAMGVLLQIKSLEQLINKVTLYQTWNAEIGISLVYCVFALILMNLFSVLRGYLDIQMKKCLDQNYIPIVLSKYDRIEYAELESSETQNLLRYVSSNPQSNLISLFNASLMWLSSVISMIEILWIFLSTSLWIGIAAVILFIPIVLFNERGAHWEMRQRWTMTKDIRKRYYLQSLFVDKDALQEIKIFDAKDFLIEKSEEYTERINRDLRKNLSKVLTFNTISVIFLLAYIGICIFVLSYGILNNTLMLGTYAALLTCIERYYSAVQSMAKGTSQITRLSENINMLRKFFDLPERVTGDIGEMHQVISERMEIEFSHVSFHYPNSEKMVLQDVSFVIREGENISFVGENGAGKSTIVKLICGLYLPTEGEVKVAGIPTNLMTPEMIQKVISIVFQDGKHYQLSLRENIALGNLEFLQKDSFLIESLQKVGIQELADLPKGLDHALGRIEEDAVDLSGGQWQRVLIARAIMAQSHFIILDEPTAALDPVAENNLYRSFSDVISAEGRGSIVISHRLASCKMADRIMVIKGGNIVEEGSHDMLMCQDGYYADMYRKQSEWYV